MNISHVQRENGKANVEPNRIIFLILTTVLIVFNALLLIFLKTKKEFHGITKRISALYQASKTISKDENPQHDEFLGSRLTRGELTR
jgi:hypothetical protein